MRVHHLGHRSAMLIATLLALSLSACGMMPKQKTQAAAEEAKPLSDSEIVAVVSTLNRGELRQADLAMQRSNNPQVQGVAERIISDHLAMERKLEAWAQSAGIQPKESALSRSLQKQAQQLTDKLRDASGAEFNRAYLEGQAKMHEVALNTVRKQLLPAAHSRQLKQMLQAAAPELEAHKEAAQESRQALAD